jgi:hypothetical protein
MHLVLRWATGGPLHDNPGAVDLFRLYFAYSRTLIRASGLTCTNTLFRLNAHFPMRPPLVGDWSKFSDTYQQSTEYCTDNHALKRALSQENFDRGGRNTEYSSCQKMGLFQQSVRI